MRPVRFTVAALAVLTGVPALADDKCKAEVEAAFVKQRQAPAFRTVATTDTPNGAIVRTIDYVAPDRLYSKIVSPVEDAPVETIGIGKHAWANTEGGWEEQPPHLAQMVTRERESYKVPPKAATDFACKGAANVGGKDVLSYASAPARNPDGREVVTTIHVEKATGLPVSYVTEPVKGGTPVFKAEYSYGKDIAVLSPSEPAADDTAETEKK
jgi:hypothetical protein